MSAGFVKSSSGKDALNNNHTWEFFLSKIRDLDLGGNDCVLGLSAVLVE